MPSLLVSLTTVALLLLLSWSPLAANAFTIPAKNFATWSPPLIPVIAGTTERTNRACDSVLFSSAEPATSSHEGDNAPSSKNSFSKRVLLARVLVGALIFAAGTRLGALSVQEGASQWMKAVASPTKSRSKRFYLVSTLLALVLTRDLWNAVPAWAKPGLVRRAVADTKRMFGVAVAADESTHSDGNIDTADFSDFGSLAAKFRGVLQIAERRIPPSAHLNLRSSLYALVQTTRALKSQRAAARDDLYAQCGPAATAADLHNMPEWMELADAAYDELPDDESLQEYLDGRGWDLIKHDTTLRPGRVGHYVALHQSRKEAVIGIKGTSGLEDLITDMCGVAIEYELKDGPFVEEYPSNNNTNSTIIRAHEGVALSTELLANDLQPIVERLLLAQDFSITIVGHSLGAASAALLAVLLRSRLPKLLHGDENLHKLQVLAFASPPTLDKASALACEPFVTSIVNNCDVITRSNAGPVLVTVELLKKLHSRMQEMTGKDDDTPIGMLTAVSLMNRLDKERKAGNSAESSMLITPEKFEDVLNKALETVGDDDKDQLYITGRVLLLYDLWEEEAKYEEDEDEANDERQEEYDYSADRAVVTSPTAIVLRYLEFDGRLIEDHMAPSYKSSLRNVVKLAKTKDQTSS